jgi:hypothetical protein
MGRFLVFILSQVWVKQRGYPWWPALVDAIRREHELAAPAKVPSCHVLFLGDKGLHQNIKEKHENIREWNDPSATGFFKGHNLSTSNVKDFEIAIQQAEQVALLPNLERVAALAENIHTEGEEDNDWGDLSSVVCMVCSDGSPKNLLLCDGEIHPVRCRCDAAFAVLVPVSVYYLAAMTTLR